ncbi:hypothetical protein B4168_1470 [Anoxybacillus flavithermus]|nr:hypothetical protein B4168_1470 [Anoxybacillus flavithermus]OAO84126.1 hypothetical protein GT23_3661 [Parageobacillus thermoglucosidasius]
MKNQSKSAYLRCKPVKSSNRPVFAISKSASFIKNQTLIVIN